MYKIKVYSIGKTKENWLQEALSAYQDRLKPTLCMEWILAKSNEQLKQFLKNQTHFVCLDSQGKQFSSEEFSIYLINSLQECHSRLSFVIGGAEGIPSGIRFQASQLISLSKMTFTHQIARLILVEQIYRAFEIDKASPYHK
jgi:23S rRNA (pseudouridine1915-N3)-methyltransferase